MALVLFFMAGCATITVKPPKEPIKVDVSMRIDVYQHIQKDIDNIEDIVNGPQGDSGQKTSDDQSFLEQFAGLAYAQEGLNPEVEQAAFRRKDRRQELASSQRKGIVGESRFGLAEIRNRQEANSSVENLVKTENLDRMVIYQAIAQKNGTSIESVQKIYAERLQRDAPVGTPIEVFSDSEGSYEWKIK